MGLKKKIGEIYRNFRYPYETELIKATSNCKTLLDVGCGDSSPVKRLPREMHKVGIDLFAPAIEKSRSQGIHDEYFQMGVMDIEEVFGHDSFDCVVALDLIEHLEKKEGEILLKKMENVASEKIIIFTPNGFLSQGVHYDNPWQIHKSGWSADEMKERGYSVIGINGWKPLRGELGEVRWKPSPFWRGVSLASNVIVKSMPTHAFQILCIKSKE